MDKSKTTVINEHEFEIEQEYIDCVSDILTHKITGSMDLYIQHSDITCLDHCLYVSYFSYKACKKLRLDFRCAARGALLHDFFLYDWHKEKPYKGLHGFHHSRIALKNAKENFVLSELEQDIIYKHMWPLTSKIPKHKESFIVLMVDKYCALTEIFKLAKKNINKLKRCKDFAL